MPIDSTDKYNKIASLVEKYSLAPKNEVLNSLHKLYLLFTCKIKTPDNPTDFETDIQSSQEILQKVWIDFNQADLKSVKFDLTVKGTAYKIKLKSEYLKWILLEKLNETVERVETDIHPTQKKKGRKNTKNVALIEFFIPVAIKLQQVSNFKNKDIYKFLIAFLNICEFDWNETAYGSVQTDIESARIDVVKTYIGPYLKKGK